MIIATTSHATPLGDLYSSWTGQGLYRLSWEPPQNGVNPRSNLVVQLDELLQQYFTGGPSNFHQIEVDPVGWTEFSRRVYDSCRQIQPGETLSYKELARLAGNEKASRAVGTAMAKNRVAIVIPCHRVLASGGKLGGYSAPGGLQTKQFLLEWERNPS